MRSLFLKIFLSFWLAQALFMVLAILVTIALRSQRETATWEALQVKVLDEAVREYESGGEQAIRRYLSHLQDSQHLHAFLFNNKGEEVSGARPPEWIADLVRGEQPSPSTFRRLFMRGRFGRQSVTGSDGERYTLLLDLPRGPRVLLGPPGFPGPGILIAVVSSGLVCYILARYLTAPISRLRAATHKLAGGDLTARAGTDAPAELRRGDEISQLITDFDTMAERLEGLVKAQSRLLNDISHELRSPLARLNVALALARQRTSPESQWALERIDLESNRLNELIGRLLTIARLESRDNARGPSLIKLRELVNEIAKDADFEAQIRHCHVKTDIPQDCQLLGDPELLRSAIENVVRNGIRYTRAGTDVEIQVECERLDISSAAILRVSDSGPGVPEEALGKLFQPFYRIDDARGRQTGGVGLGLAITDRAVRLHGGRVRAANRPGGGLVVEIRLPLVAEVEPEPSHVVT